MWSHLYGIIKLKCLLIRTKAFMEESEVEKQLSEHTCNSLSTFRPSMPLFPYPKFVRLTNEKRLLKETFSRVWNGRLLFKIHIRPRHHSRALKWTRNEKVNKEWSKSNRFFRSLMQRLESLLTLLINIKWFRECEFLLSIYRQTERI